MKSYLNYGKMQRNVLILHKCGITKECSQLMIFPPPPCSFSHLNKRLTLAQIGLASFLSYHIPQKEAKLILSIRRLKADGVGRCFIFSGMKEVAWASLASLKIMVVGGNVLILVKLQKGIYTFLLCVSCALWHSLDGKIKMYSGFMY